MTDERAIEDRIRARAHEIWEREGRPEGEDLRHWDEARLEIEAEERLSPAPSPGASAEPEDASPAEVFPEAGRDAAGGAAGEEAPVESETIPSQVDRSPM